MMITFQRIPMSISGCYLTGRSQSSLKVYNVMTVKTTFLFTLSAFLALAAFAGSRCLGSDMVSIYKCGGAACAYQPYTLFTYKNSTNHVNVSFYLNSNDSTWQMNVLDDRDLNRELYSDSHHWGPDSSLCSKQQILAIIGQSLTRFHVIEPDAKLRDVFMEMHITRELWREILLGVRTRMRSYPGVKLSMNYSNGEDMRSDPEVFEKAATRIVKVSSVTKAIAQLLRQRGVRVNSVVLLNCNPWFKDSLSGKKWSDIAKLRDDGFFRSGSIDLGTDAN